MYKDTEIQKLIDNLDIVQVIGEYVTLKKTGANYKGLSPFKDEKTPSFVVSPNKNIFKDFSTGIGGNVISFYMRINNLSFYEAVEELSRKYNISINKFNIEKNRDNPNARYYEIMREAQSFFKNNMINSDEAMEYMKNRGYSLEEIRKFEIGFSLESWNSLLNYLKEKGYNENELLELGLIRKNDEGNIVSITYKGRMEAGEFTSFPFIALNPKSAVEPVKYKAYVTYEDGVIVPFDGSEEAKGYQPTIQLK